MIEWITIILALYGAAMTVLVVLFRRQVNISMDQTEQALGIIRRIQATVDAEPKDKP